MNDLLVVTLLASGILYGTPLIIAGIGELLAERSGVLNLSVEGIMLMGAATAFWTSQSITEGPSWLALTAAILVGAFVGILVALILTFSVITMRANQVVSGLALLIFCGPLGLSNYLGTVGNLASSTGQHRLPKLDLFGLGDLAVVGPLIFNQDVLVYFSWILTIGAGFYLTKTRAGLHLRAVGEEPNAADAMGVNVVAYRYFHTLLGGALAGVAGAYYSLSISVNWVNNITAGAGWIAIALVILAFWRPLFVVIGAYLFGVVTSLGFTLQALGFKLPAELFSSLPYLLTLFAVILASGRLSKFNLKAPAALGLPFRR
ncbi:MAG: ABC transporter permease [Albidovulum sp.]|nr:ABC transporter permease [Albidovulum sp.]